MVVTALSNQLKSTEMRELGREASFFHLTLYIKGSFFHLSSAFTHSNLLLHSFEN